ncbi:acyl-CoA synthetase family protein [Halopelagius longus]|uniref:AMP-binding enzyme n=1 Tax=Halopelagius longus TaxID=1236180 RepID=A0A1H1AIT6_9EURY|nr:AMP-binding protein [Halopelagius longus]RDI70393.1 acetyl-CoA synthetase [Halopelagius longus]SDQ39589.1 AMP-binding enzyme [Halopelagius longus]
MTAGDGPEPVTDPAVLGDAVSRDRRAPATALRADAPGRSYSYYDFVTTSYKAGNVLRYLGVREGDRVDVEPDRLPEPVLTFYGAAQLGAVVSFDPDPDASDPPRAAVVPVERESEFATEPGSKLAVYGGPPERPTTTHWEKEVWSENPAVHPASVAAEDPLLAADRTYSHAEVLSAAAAAAEDADLRPGEDVAVRGSLSHPGVVAAGLVAPVLVGATILFPDGDAEGEGPSGDVRVGGGPERRAIDPDSVFGDD